MTNDARDRQLSAEQIAEFVVIEGIRAMIVLDLKSVGRQDGGGSTIDLCRRIHSQHPDVELISGGGVKDERDVLRFVDAGCKRVLVATALHRGAFDL